MIRRLRMSITINGKTYPPQVKHVGPMPSARALPDSVRQLAKDRPPIPLPRAASPWPLVNAEGITWAEAKRRKEEAQ